MLKQKKIRSLLESISDVNLKLFSTNTKVLKEETDIVTALTNIVKSVKDLKLDESESKEINEGLEDINKSIDENDTDKLLNSINVIEQKLKEMKYDPKTMDENSDLVLGEQVADDLETIDVKINEIGDELNNSITLSEVENVETKVKSVDESLEDTEKKINDITDVDIKETVEDQLQETKNKFIAFKKTLKEAKELAQDEDAQNKLSENQDQTKVDELDKIISEEVEKVLTDKTTPEDKLKECADNLEKIKVERDKLVESEDGEYKGKLTEEDIKDLETKVNEALQDVKDGKEVEEDKVDDIIKQIGEEKELIFGESDENADNIIEEGLNSLFKKAGFKNEDIDQFKTLFEYAVKQTANKAKTAIVESQERKFKKLAESLGKIAKRTGNTIFNENKENFTNAITLEESKKVVDVIASALSSNGFVVNKKAVEIIESKNKEINKLNESLKAKRKNAIDKNEIKELIKNITESNDLSISQRIKLSEMVSKIDKSDKSIFESTVNGFVKEMILNENKKQPDTKGKTTLNENKNPPVEDNKHKNLSETEILINKSLGYM